MEQINRLLRYLHDPEPKNESKEPIVCLSKSYSDIEKAGSEVVSGTKEWPRDFVVHQGSLFCFTYRTGFSKILRDPRHLSLGAWFNNDGFTTDVGFGCMIRSAQTLLANVISTLQLGEHWRRGALRDKEAEILRLFADDPEAPYSIHKFIEYGAQACGKPAGQWFGPNAASLCIKSLTLEHQILNLRVYVAAEQGGTIYEDEVLEIARREGNFLPLLLLVPQRLGHDKINPKYHQSLAALFEMPTFMGIAGGRPSSAHFFFAKQDQNLFFLDPHTDRPSLPYHQDVTDYTDLDFDDCHTTRIRRMPMTDMDPSMLIGFLIKDEAAWTVFKDKMNESQGKLRLATITDTRPTYMRRASQPEERDDEDSDVLLDEDGLQ